MHDEKIVELYWQRSDEAIQETARKFSSYCHTIAYNILNDISDSEECVNDTWLAAWNSMPSNRPSKLAPYLGKITRNLALNIAFAQSRKKRVSKNLTLALDELDECVANDADLERAVELNELRAAIREFVSSLPEEERRFFLARYWYFESEKEISERMGCTRSKLASKLSRTRKKLKEYLREEGLI